MIAHPHRLGEDNAGELEDMGFVFICMDSGPDKRALIELMERVGIPFIDTGMGLDEHDGTIGGIMRVTTSTPAQRQHVWTTSGSASRTRTTRRTNTRATSRWPTSIALNACLAVIRWKKLFGFYRDLEDEHNTLYTVDGNHLLNEDQA